MSDEVTKKIETEVAGLQDKLKDRLKQTEELGDLEQGLKKQTFSLEKTTEEHQSVSRETRNKMWWKYAKWVALIVIVIGLLALIFVRPLISSLMSLI